MKLCHTLYATIKQIVSMLLKTAKAKKDIEMGQFLDTPRITPSVMMNDKDKDGANDFAPTNTAQSQWPLDSLTLEAQHSPPCCLRHQPNACASLERHECVLQQKEEIRFDPKFPQGHIHQKDVVKPTQTNDDVSAKRRFVDEFEILDVIGEGTYGVVFRACNKKTREIVALKKFKAEKGIVDPTSANEFQILSSIHHPSIIGVKEVVVNRRRVSPTEYMVMEYMEHNLEDLIQTPTIHPFSQSEVKCLMLQLLDGVKFLHDNGVIHRDLKPSNLLLNNCGDLKICDFGTAKWFGSQPLKHTYEIVTLWYRAPELLFGAKEYSIAIDMWALGCIMSSFLLKRTLFLGGSRLHQINQICEVLGTPSKEIWPNFEHFQHIPPSMIHQPFHKLREQFASGSSITKPTLTQKGLDLLDQLLTYDPLKRITANEALRHEWFQEIPLPKAKELMPTFPIKI